MKKTLKLKIFASFMLLIMMLAVAGSITIYQFRYLSFSFHGIIQDNYRTIEASKSMIEALEREDSGILLLLLGDWKAGRDILNSADSSFSAAFKAAENNLTELNEEHYVKDIQEKYIVFKNKWQRPIVQTDKEGNIDWYKNDIHQSFLETKNAVTKLMTLNQGSMYNEASELQDKSHRAIMPSLVSIVAAVIFSLLLNFFITKYFITPVSKLADAVNNFHADQKRLNVNITSDDEIKKLEVALEDLIQRLI